MPTYEYKCTACGHAFERFQSMTAEPVKKCPECGKNKVKRLLGTGAGLIFKGSGFYITDYRSESYKNAAKAETGGGGSESKSDGSAATTEAKPAAGGESKPAAAAPAPAVPAAAPKSESKPAPKKGKK